MSEKTVKLELLNPRGVIEAKPTLSLTPRVIDLAGKRGGLYWNSKPGMDNFFTVFDELLRKRYPTAPALTCGSWTSFRTS